MKASKFVLRTFSVPMLFVVLALFAFGKNSDAAIPEPNTSIFGKVINTWQGHNVPMAGGTVAWTFTQKYGDRKSFTFTADIDCVACNKYVDGECVDCDDYTYNLRISQEAIASLQGPTDDSIPLPGNDQLYYFSNVTVNGYPATVVILDEYGNITATPDEPFDILFSQDRRVHYYEANLEVVFALVDTDNDGIPDYWESQYGLNPNLDIDAGLDLDNDGWTNLEEYQNNTDPTVSNRGPTLTTTSITVYEKATSVVYLRAADSDTAPEFISYKLITPPQGGSLWLRYGNALPVNFSETSPVYTDLGCSKAFYDRADLSQTALQVPQYPAKKLAANDQFTQKDIDDGLLVFIHEDISAGPISFDITVLDPDSNQTGATVNVSVFRPSRTDGSDAELWLDADEPGVTPVGNRLETWVGRSGNEEYATALATISENNGVFTTDSSDLTIDPNLNGKKTVTAGKGNANYGMSFNPGDSIVSEAGDRTIFTVLKPAGQNTGLMQVFSTPTFEIGVSGDDAVGVRGNLRYASGGQAVYSNYPVDDKWTIASTLDENGEVEIRINGMRVGGPYSGIDTPALAPYSHLYAKSRGADVNTGMWGYSDIYKGNIAEMLVFTKIPDPLKRQRINAYLRSKWFGAVVWDASGQSRNMVMKGAYSGFSQGKYQAYVSQWGPDRDHIFIGGAGNDTIRGAGENNIIIGMAGDDTLYGGIHRDLFVFLSDNDGHDTINRFGECDAIDLSTLFDGTGVLSDYINFTAAGGNTDIGVDVNGDGGGFDDITITLVGRTYQNSDMFKLWIEGKLLTGGVRPQFPITVEMPGTELSETSSSPLSVKIHFPDNLQAIPDGLVIPFVIGGSAQGLRQDYYIQMQAYDSLAGKYIWLEITENTMAHEFPIRLRPGDNLLEMRIYPIPDTSTENKEDITITFLPNDQLYDLGQTRAFTASIVEGQDQVAIEATRPITHENHLEGGEFVVSRSGGSLDQPLTVKVNIIGSAQNGVDYKYVSSEFDIPANQSQVAIQIKPYKDSLDESVEIVEMVLVDTSYYVIKDDGSAQVFILDQKSMKGDIDLNEKIDLADAIMLAQILTGKNDFEQKFFPESSLDGDNKLTIEDLVLMLQIIAELKQP